MLVLVTYATKAYRPSAELLRQSALSNGFEKVIILGPEIQPRVEGSQKGHGSYSWKPTAILRALTNVCQDDDVLVYADATMTFHHPFTERFTSPVNLFRIGDAGEKHYTTAAYTKPTCIQRMNGTPAEMQTLQVNAALQAYTKTPEALEFLQEYESWCSDPACVGHDPRHPNHRHDQSILTVLAHRYGSHVVQLPDPTQYGGAGAIINHHRQVLRPMQTLVVVTPTTGKNLDWLTRAMDSVQRQQIVCLRHLVVCDGPEATKATLALREEYLHRIPVQWLDLPYVTGGYNCHRIYGASPFLAAAAHDAGPCQLLAFLDEDNWYADDHLSLMLDTLLDGGHDAVHSLRKIFQGNDFVCNDNCESLGRLAPSSQGAYFLADTSTWLLKHDAAVRSSHCWDARARDPHKPEVDRALTSFLLNSCRVGTVAQHSLNYSAGSGTTSVKPSYFMHCNTINRWNFQTKPNLYLFHFNAEQTAKFFETQFDASRSYMLDEWNLGQCRVLHNHFNLIDGYATLPHLPSGATTLAHMCIPHELPLDFFASRKDLRKLVYTAESPNIRHQEQWHLSFLEKIATDVLTYWKPLLNLSAPFTTHPCLHQCHHFDDGNPHDLKQFRLNTGASGTICMVLENRPGLEIFQINDTKLSCLDGLRAHFARMLAEKGFDVTVHGKGWNHNGPWQIGGNAGKYLDQRHSVDILQHHSAALIVENVDADGYVSEKVYDALLAGAVPIFYNSHPIHLPSECHFNLATDSFTDITSESILSKRAHVYRLRQAIIKENSSHTYADAVCSALKIP